MLSAEGDPSLPIRIAKITLDRKIVSKTVQSQRVHLRRFAHATKSRTSGERNRTSSGENLWSIVQEHFVHDTSGERRPVDGSPAFNHQAGDFELTQPAVVSLFGVILYLTLDVTGPRSGS